VHDPLETGKGGSAPYSFDFLAHLVSGTAVYKAGGFSLFSFRAFDMLM